MTEKEIFIKQFRSRTKKLAVDTIRFCELLKSNKASSVITYQLIKSATSIGANYRAACRARSRPEFYSKICIVVEEADETGYWLEIIEEAGLSNEKGELKRLQIESEEITRIMAKIKHTTSNSLKK